jgi:hypothetical protein
MMPMTGRTRTSGSHEAVRNLVSGIAETGRRQPVILLGRDDAYQALNKFVAAEITAIVRHLPLEAKAGTRGARWSTLWHGRN